MDITNVGTHSNSLYSRVSSVSSRSTSASSKTPILKRSPRKLLNAASTCSLTPVTVAFINNDEEERRQRRLGAHMRCVISPGVRPQNCTSVGSLSSLSNTQIAEHYADCIKLSSENKINSKNAFGLHLIDYMLEVLLERGELENFQIAGCTLDAGAKIYASRVDSIYTDAYKILGGIGKNEQQEQVQPDVHLHTRERAKREASSTATIEGNLKVINMCSKDLQLEMDPFFKHISEEGLMLHQLVTLDDYSLVLDMDSDSISDVDNVQQDGSELRASLAGVSYVASCDNEICFTFSTLLLSDGCSDINTVEMPHCSNTYPQTGPNHTPTVSSVKQVLSSEDYSMVPFPITPSDSDCDDAVASSQDLYAKVIEVAHCQGVEKPLETCDASVLGICGNRNIALHEVRAKQSNIDRGDLLVTSTLWQSDYSYFDTSTFPTWAGIEHWKLRSCSSNNDRGTRNASAKQRHGLKISFFDTFCEKPFITCKALTLPPAETDLACTCLPQDAHLKMTVLLELFIHAKWKVEKMKPYVVEDELDGSWCEYAECCNSEVHGQSSLNVFDGSFCEVLEATDSSMSNFNLVAQPQKVQKVSLSYAKNSKRINAKKLKETMWEVIMDADPVNVDRNSFQQMYYKICEIIPQSMKHDISVPICFVFLLHLANEKGLIISEEAAICDVHIEVLAK